MAVIDFKGEVVKLIIDDVGEFILYSGLENAENDQLIENQSSQVTVKRFYDSKAAVKASILSLVYQESFTLSGSEPHILVEGSYWAIPCNTITIAKYTDYSYNYYTVTRSESWFERNYYPVKVNNAFYATKISGVNENESKYDKFYKSTNRTPFGDSTSNISDIYVSTSAVAYNGWNPVRTNGISETITHLWTADLYWYETYKKQIVGNGGIWFTGY